MARILVVEDEESIRDSIIEILSADRHECLEAANGRQGVELAHEYLPDLIVCDVIMPELDGFGVLNELRQDPVTATISFIFLTAKAEKTDQRLGMDLGADDYLTKPFSVAELRRTVATRLARQSSLEQKINRKMQELRASIALALPHELRTPLTGILGFSELLMDESSDFQPQEIRSLAGYIYTSGERLLRLIENFTFYIELEQLAAEPEQLIALRDERPEAASARLIGEVAQRESERANRDDDLKLEIQPALLAMDDKHLHKLAAELVNNAFKFSSAGTPVQVTGQLLNPPNYQLTISDHGQGMTAQQIAAIGAYQQFGRQQYEQQGAGLGLAIVKRLVELYGGTLTITSEPAGETTAQVQLPIVNGGGANDQ